MISSSEWAVGLAMEINMLSTTTNTNIAMNI